MRNEGVSVILLYENQNIAFYSGNIYITLFPLETKGEIMGDDTGLTSFFESYLKKDSLFLNKTALQANYTPETIEHRDEQINLIANILAPSLKLDKPSNIFIYGKTGTGKTLVVKHITKKMTTLAEHRNIPIKIIYLNCKLKKIADTEYRLIASLLSEAFDRVIPPTGLPTDEVYRIFYDTIESKKQLIMLVLDEIDQLVKKTSDSIMYNLLRINSELKNSQIAIIGISNDVSFTELLDSRVKSSLCEEDVIFPAYDAFQIQDILRKRSEQAIKKDFIEKGVIEKCAAYAAREHGDARRALELLRVAGELAERNGDDKIGLCHLDEAESKIERDSILDILETQPKQFQATFYSILRVYEKINKSYIFTGDIYNFYKELCKKIVLRPLTQRRLSDIIGELDMLGLINAKVISKGRYGRTREISVSIGDNIMNKAKDLLVKKLELD